MKKLLLLFLFIFCFLPAFAIDEVVNLKEPDNLRVELIKISQSIYQDWSVYHEDPEVYTYYGYLKGLEETSCNKNNNLNCKYTKLVLNKYHELVDLGYKSRTPSEGEISQYLKSRIPITIDELLKLDKGFYNSAYIFFKYKN